MRPLVAGYVMSINWQIVSAQQLSTKTHTHLSIFQRDYTGVFGGADNVIIIADPLNGPLSKTLNTVSLGGYTHTQPNFKKIETPHGMKAEAI